MAMNQKQLIMIIIAFSLTLILAFSSLFVVYSLFPEWLGLETEDELLEKQKKQVLPPLINKVYVSKERIDEYQNHLLINEILNLKKDSLQNTVIDLNKQILSLYKNISTAQDSIKKLAENNISNNTSNKKLNDSLSVLYTDLMKSKNQVKLLEKRTEDYERWLTKKYDSLEAKNFTEFAKIYNNSNPEEVAKILEQIEERDAAFILKNMNKKKAGKILEAMQPERAAAILLLGADER